MGFARFDGGIARAGELRWRRGGQYRHAKIAEATAPYYIGRGKAQLIKESFRTSRSLP